MADPDPHTPNAGIVPVAASLVVVTYLESILVEYPHGWLPPVVALAGLAALLLAQIGLLSALLRRLRRSHDSYSVFFSRTTWVVLAAYVALTVLFLAPDGAALVHRELGAAASTLGPALGSAA